MTNTDFQNDYVEFLEQRLIWLRGQIYETAKELAYVLTPEQHDQRVDAMIHRISLCIKEE